VSRIHKRGDAVSVNKPYCYLKDSRHATTSYRLLLRYGSMSDPKYTPVLRRTIPTDRVRSEHAANQCSDCVVGKLSSVAWLAVFLVKLEVLRLEKYDQ
jgi:hypothetical protein